MIAGRIGRETSVETRTSTPSPSRTEPPWRTCSTPGATCRRENTVLKRYYEMKNEMRSLGISIPPMLEKVDCVTGWCAKAVKAHSVRSVFDGFVFDGAEDSTSSASCAKKNRLQ